VTRPGGLGRAMARTAGRGVRDRRPRSPAGAPPAVYKAVCRRTREVVVLKSYQLSAICELYRHQIFRRGSRRVFWVYTPKSGRSVHA
jgi:hypothetical protein